LAHSSDSERAVGEQEKTMAAKLKHPASIEIKRQLVNEIELAEITGRPRRTWQKDRLFNRGAPFYRVRGSIYYDLQETLAWMKSQKGGGEAA
jgi:hypothetical protein